MAADEPGGPAGGGGSILTRKTGPLANWIWMAIILLVALVYSMWKRNREQAVAPPEDETVTEPLPGNQNPPPVFILPQNPQPTVPININLPPNPTTPVTPKPVPPTGGRPLPPTIPVQPAQPVPKPVTPVYEPVKMVKYTSKNPPWNSTIWGIAKQYGYGAASNNWTSIWNDPKNAALKAKRKTYGNLQPGDVVYVKRK